MKHCIMAALAMTLLLACNSALSTPEGVCKKVNKLNSEVPIDECISKLSKLKEMDKAMFDRVAECVSKAGAPEELSACNKMKK